MTNVLSQLIAIFITLYGKDGPIWKLSRPSVFYTILEFGNEEVFYEDAPVLDVLRKIAVDRHGRPVPHLASDGVKLAMAILAAKVSGTASSSVLKMMIY